ncbi:hypothetical protein LAZ67_19002579 [Cordylochernes scorpioides]|uniref:Uncharacterized protein n=1 Tax=Cordylochernes scorpioides TaxID=51811 RepID=A0ABY6LLH7_9ARAC|nr:hypothetical protein LAZ67_19002579 [Cordylochernes scorpioides]
MFQMATTQPHMKLLLAGAGVVLSLLSLCFWCLLRWRCKPRYEYAVLEDEAALQDKIELDRKQQRDAERRRRLDKHWFVVCDSTTGAERLMSLARVQCGRRWAALVQEILRASHHPYILPILELSAPDNLLCVTPLNPTGSLKDLIHHVGALSTPTYPQKLSNDLKDSAHHVGVPSMPIILRNPQMTSKIPPTMRTSSGTGGTSIPTLGPPLPEPHIQQLGSQILEGLLFLRERGLTNFGHLHSGNVILQNGVAR